MPRLRNTKTDAILSCSDEVAAQLGSEWEPADKPAAKKAPAQKAASSKSEK